MRACLHAVIAACLFGLPAGSVVAKQIQLLHGELSFATPEDVSQASGPIADTDRYSVLADLTSADHTFSVRVTYGKHSLKKPDLADFLQQKISSYSKPSVNRPRFRWLRHTLVERQDRQWADVSFTHDIPSGSHVYTRSISCFRRGRLLEIWVLTRRAADHTQKAGVDRLVDSVQLRTG
jgi:hypothetical protein